jgi:hypothetical protein
MFHAPLWTTIELSAFKIFYEQGDRVEAKTKTIHEAIRNITKHLVWFMDRFISIEPTSD